MAYSHNVYKGEAHKIFFQNIGAYILQYGQLPLEISM